MSEADKLEQVVTALLREAGVTEPTPSSRHGDHRWWDRQIGHVRRHMKLVPIMDDGDEGKFMGRYSVLFGQYTGSGQTDRENFDARRWGELDEVLDYVRTWLVEWAGPEKMKTPRM